VRRKLAGKYLLVVKVNKLAGKQAERLATYRKEAREQTR
jgi:hypothetical protein